MANSSSRYPPSNFDTGDRNQDPSSSARSSGWSGYYGHYDQPPLTQYPNGPPSSLETATTLSTFKDVGTANLNGPVVAIHSPNSVAFHVGARDISSISQPNGFDNTPANENDNARQSEGNLIGNGDTQRPQMRPDYEIYYDQLLLQGRGSPLWFPASNKRRHIEAQRKGIDIGDVGVIYHAGGFHFLFNVFLPADHEFHKSGVPEGFSPLNFSEFEDSLYENDAYGEGSYLIGSSIRKTSENSYPLTFERCGNGTEGAILVMPDGATTFDLFNLDKLQVYAEENAEHWYSFAKKIIGERVENGDVRLVFGSHKVSSWGIATFGGGHEEAVRFKFEKFEDEESFPKYKWECTGGSHTFRAGPTPAAIRALRKPTDLGPLQNQCIFLRTMNISFGEGAWKTFIDVKIRSGLSNSTASSDFGGGGVSRLANTEPSSAASRAPDASALCQGQGSMQYPRAVNHPSKALNKCLIEKFPGAKIIITDDTHWISVLTEDDVVFPDAMDLCNRILAKYDLCEKDGIVTLQTKRVEDYFDWRYSHVSHHSTSTPSSDRHSRECRSDHPSPSSGQLEGAQSAPLSPLNYNQASIEPSDQLMDHQVDSSSCHDQPGYEFPSIVHPCLKTGDNCLMITTEPPSPMTDVEMGDVLDVISIQDYPIFPSSSLSRPIPKSEKGTDDAGTNCAVSPTSSVGPSSKFVIVGGVRRTSRCQERRAIAIEDPPVGKRKRMSSDSRVKNHKCPRLDCTRSFTRVKDLKRHILYHRQNHNESVKTSNSINRTSLSPRKETFVEV